MRRAFLAAVLAGLAAAPLAAQQQASKADGAILRTLDKVSGQVFDHTVSVGGGFDLGLLRVDLSECRFPAGDPSGDAYAHVTVRDGGEDVPIYSGWMIASSPALSALDHARYDVWVIRCKIS